MVIVLTIGAVVAIVLLIALGGLAARVSDQADDIARLRAENNNLNARVESLENAVKPDEPQR